MTATSTRASRNVERRGSIWSLAILALAVLALAVLATSAVLLVLPLWYVPVLGLDAMQVMQQLWTNESVRSGLVMWSIWWAIAVIIALIVAGRRVRAHRGTSSAPARLWPIGAAVLLQAVLCSAICYGTSSTIHREFVLGGSTIGEQVTGSVIVWVALVGFVMLVVGWFSDYYSHRPPRDGR